MKIYKMLPGHGNKGGKVYSFLGKDGLKEGQRVVAPYRHWVSGKIHDTMWTIMDKGASADSEYGAAEMDRLADTKTKAGRDVQLRRIKGTDILGGLPGGKKYGQLMQDKGMSERQAKTLWTLNSNIQDRKSRDIDTKGREKARDIILGIKPKQDNASAAKRLLGG